MSNLTKIPLSSEEQEAALRRTIELDPTLVEAHLSLAHFLEAQGRIDEGMVTVQQAVRLDSRSWLSHLLMSSLHARRKENKQALGEAVTAFKLHPSPWTWIHLTWIYRRINPLVYLIIVAVLALSLLSKSFLFSLMALLLIIGHMLTSAIAGLQRRQSKWAMVLGILTIALIAGYIALRMTT